MNAPEEQQILKQGLVIMQIAYNAHLTKAWQTRPLKVLQNSNSEQCLQSGEIYKNLVEK